MFCKVVLRRGRAESARAEAHRWTGTNSPGKTPFKFEKREMMTRMWPNLENALETLRGQSDKSLLILEAVVGERPSKVTDIWDVKWWDLKHRVIGLRLKSMDEAGLFYCEREECDDEDDLEMYVHTYEDVLLLSK
ncbi:hypothetical protein LTR64_008783 [Lithohypha guttulata]|uniref:uncharacterized protein n=1 Tax=Lithohypha guttulata TaxID=1690604 RepID=UPI00315D1CE6